MRRKGASGVGSVWSDALRGQSRWSSSLGEENYSLWRFEAAYWWIGESRAFTVEPSTGLSVCGAAGFSIVPGPIFGTEGVSQWHEASSREGNASSVGEK